MHWYTASPVGGCTGNIGRRREGRDESHATPAVVIASSSAGRVVGGHR